MRQVIRCAPVMLLFAALAQPLHAQSTVSVPFTNGFIGTRGSSAGTANNVLTYATLGITRTFFIQNSSTNSFELQGNDIPGTLRIVRTNGTIIDMPASANWRSSGGTTFLIGILPRPASPITLNYSGGSIQITDGSVSGGSSIGGYIAGYTGSMLADGESTSGNAAQSQVLIGLNAYLATVVTSRPAGPVTVNALTTSNPTPTIAGTATLAAGETLSVVVNGFQYTSSSSPAVVVSGTNWSLALATTLSPGTYSVTATITNADGFTLSDPTSNELVITAGGGTVTIGGSFSANDKVYDGTTAATGNTAGLTLSGVHPSHSVTIASVTLAFQDATVGAGRTVGITAVTLGGADASLYTVNLAGAPTATAAITPRTLTIGGSFTAANKVHDGTTAATISGNSLTLVGVVGGDAVSLTGLAAAFADPAVGTGKTVSLTAASLTGAAAANYTLSLAGAPTTSADITAATPPSAPRNVAGVPGDGALTVTWLVPQVAGCSTISGYLVQYSTDGGQSWMQMAVAASPTALTLPHMTNNVAHHVRVAAVNSCGTGPFSAAAGPVVPVGPARGASGRPVTSPPGTGSITTGGVSQPATIDIVQDTIARVTDGEFSLRLRALDAPGTSIPIGAARTLLLEQGGSAAADGSGFAPGSFVTLYIFTETGLPILLGMVEVGSDGSFATAPTVPATLPPGSYTLQVNGVDGSLTPRSIALGLEILEPPADLVLTATAEELAPAVGDTITITLTVTNRGRGAAIDVVIPRAFTEPGFTIVRTTPLDGAYHDDTHEWKIERIEPGSRARMLLLVVVIPTSGAEAGR